MDAPATWHRKWLLLGAALVWVYFLRFRLLGWLVSQALTLALRWRAPRLRARAQIQYISLRPLALGHVQVVGGAGPGWDWRVVCTRVCVTTHALEFFRSFVMKKILAVAVEDVFVDLLQLDEELVREFVRAADAAARRPPTPASAAKTQRNPMGFMRFIDVHVRNISVNVDAFETRSRFRCSELSVNIPEVFVAQNFLHLSVSVASLFASSRHAAMNSQGVSSARRDSTATAQPNGLSCELGSTSIVLDVRLNDRCVIGCNVESHSEEPAYFHLSTAYVESLLTKKMELIRRDLVPTPKWMWQSEDSPSAPGGPSSCPFTLRVADFPVTMVLIHGAPGGAKVPLHLTMQIQQLEYAIKASPEERSDHPHVPTPSTSATPQKNQTGVHMRLDCQRVRLTRDTSVIDIVSTSWCRVEMDRDNAGQGRMHCEIGEMQIAVNPVMCEVLHSLVLFPDVIDDYGRATLALTLERAALKQNRPAMAPKRKTPMHWGISADVEDWSLQAWLLADENTSKRDLEAHGKRTIIRSSIPPKLSGLAMKHDVNFGEVDVQVLLQNSPVRSPHTVEEYTIGFATLSVSTSKVSTQSTKSIEISMASSSVVLNGYTRDLGRARSNQAPGLLFSNFALRQNEVESEDSVQVGIAVTITDVDAATSHSRHQEIIVELRALLGILDQVRIMLTPPDPPGSNTKISKEGATKILDLNVNASSIRAQLLDVEDVSPSVEFILNEMKVVYQKTHVGVSNTVTCAFVKMLYELDPVMDIAGVWFDQVVDAKPRLDGLLDTEPTSRSDITLSQMQLWLCPERRFLLLFLKLDELVNASNDSDQSASTPASSKASKQRVSFNCMKMGVQVRDNDPDTSTECHEIVLNQVKVHANLAKSNKITETVLLYLQATRRDESCRSRLADCIQVLTVDGTLGVQSLAVKSSKCKDALLHLDDCQFEFATSDVSISEKPSQPQPATSGKHILPPKFLVFEVSSAARYLKLSVSPDSQTAAKVVLPVLQHALDTRPSSASAPSSADSLEWRLRYVGSLDCGIQRAVVAVPFANDVFTSAYQSPLDVSDRLVVLRVEEFALSCKQLQKLSLQFDQLRVAVTDHDTDDDVSTNVRPASGDADFPLQVLYLPRTKLDAAIHWKERSVANPQMLEAPQQFAISFDLVLRSSPTSSNEQVPIADEALLSLNWDYILPALVFLATEDTDEGQGNTDADEMNTDMAKSTLECVGIQWNVSLDLVQIAWWDVMTQESAIMIVIHDLLSHGILRRQASVSEDTVGESSWVLWETTVYLDLFRAYLLREACVEDEYITLACGALPFQFTSPSRFFVETTGTSYRATHALCGSEPTPSDAGGEALFGELAFVMVERLHDQFQRVEYNFCSLNRRPSQTEPSSWTTQSNPSNGSPPKSPRAWTQSVRTKLARLKRRTSSMDNMLLNDGSRPIQVDSMKLLWTIETRDSAFNMISVIGDSVEVILEANRRVRDKQRQASLHTHTQVPSGANGSGQQGPTGTNAEASSLDARTGRRGSTRDSLLELLHQGKLGKKDSSSAKNEDSPTSWHSVQGDKPGSDNDDMHLSKTIKDKKYTLDVHDVQINILEETSRSSALIASKHIHLEVGADELGTTTVATLKFECVTGHIAPIDVEVSAGVLWYSHGRNSMHSGIPPRSPTSTNMLLKQVMEEFTLTTVYSQGLANGETSVEVDMSSLQVSTDRNQFYQLLNVLRHVLLAPPTAVNRVKRQFTTSRRYQPSEASSSEDIAVAPMPTTSAPVLLGKKLHAQLVEELRVRDAKMLGTARSSQVLLKLISFRSAGCVYRLRTSPESVGGDHEFVEIRAEGISGSHSYFVSQKTKFVVNLQWMEINNLRPGPSSIAFEDSMSVLKAKLLVDQRYQSSSRINLSNQKGMLSVRAESGPQTRVLGQKLRILDVLEISIFPEIPNMIIIQLAADFYEMLYKFFFEQISSQDHQETHNEVSLFGKKGSSTAITSTLVPPSPVAKSRAYTSPASPSQPITTRRKSIQSSSATTSSIGSESALSVPTNATELVADDDDSSADGHELFYFKYVRIGNVRLRINCNGFFVNLNNFDLDLPPYVCQSKLCTWKKLLQKFESHLKWYVTKESASTGLSHFKNKLLKWTPTSSSASDKKDKQKKEDTTAMNAQVLFGPYSGTQ